MLAERWRLSVIAVPIFTHEKPKRLHSPLHLGSSQSSRNNPQAAVLFSTQISAQKTGNKPSSTRRFVQLNYCRGSPVHDKLQTPHAFLFAQKIDEEEEEEN